jgi:DNA-binding response OmpR family regulator
MTTPPLHSRLSPLTVSPLTILVIEDQRLYQNITRECLTDYTRITAYDATTGLAVFKAERPDITFLDIGLPDGNGLRVLTDIRMVHPHAYVVMLTGSTDPLDHAEALALGAAGYVTKPFTAGELHRQIQRYERFCAQTSDRRGSRGARS